MRNEQENNYRNRRNPGHEQNANDRWGKPDPRMGPHEQLPEDRRERYRDPHEDWRAFEERENRHFQQDDRYRNNYRNEQPDWQRHDRNYNRYNQHAEDRWREEGDMRPHHHHPRHASERFYREQRRRNW